jgi:hypothetical protein
VSDVLVEIVPGREAPPFDEAELDQLIEMLRSDMPDVVLDPTYVALIRRINGGTPSRRYCSVGTVDEFLHFGKPGYGRAVDFQNVNVTWSAIEDRLVPGLVPIACDPGGNYFCLDHRQNPARVVYWVAELSEEGEPCIEEVATSVAQFVEGLSSEPLVA